MSVQVTQHDECERCPECGRVAVGYEGRYEIDHVAGCSVPTAVAMGLSAPVPGEPRGVGEDGRALTDEERKAIAALKRLAKRWPSSLTLFSWSGSLVIFKTDEWTRADSLSYDFNANDYVVDGIGGIPNDGGDP